MMLPRCDLLSNGVVIHLASGEHAVLHTVAEAEALRAVVGLALNELQEQQRQREARLDRETAAAMAKADSKAHRRWGSTLQGWPPVPLQPRPKDVA